MIDWKYIRKLRDSNKDNPNYPQVYWCDSKRKLLYVKVGDFEQEGISVNDAREMFKDNTLFITELDYLLQPRLGHGSFGVLVGENEITEEKINLEKAEQEIEAEISKIIFELDLQKSDDVMMQLKNCCLVQKYIVENITYTDSIMFDKSKYTPNNIVTLDLYNAVVLKKGVCTSNSLMFKKILERVGVNVKVIGLISKENGGKHASNIVELAGEYYFFDSTLESAIYRQYSKDGKIILCCAGLGTKEYCQFYSPKVVLPDRAADGVKPLPENISELRIPQEIVNSFITDTPRRNKK